MSISRRDDAIKAAAFRQNLMYWIECGISQCGTILMRQLNFAASALGKPIGSPRPIANPRTYQTKNSVVQRYLLWRTICFEHSGVMDAR